MPKSPFLKKNKPNHSISQSKRQKQKFAIMDYYKKKNKSTNPAKKGNSVK